MLKNQKNFMSCFREKLITDKERTGWTGKNETTECALSAKGFSYL